MIKMFDAFRRWCTDSGIAADQFEITVAPLSVEAAARFESAWHHEMRQLTLHPAATNLPTAGKIYGIPFRYRRPQAIRPLDLQVRE